MLVNRVTLDKRPQQHPRGPKVIIKEFDKSGNLLSVSLPEIENTAKVYKINESGEKIPFKIDKPIVNQEFEKDPFTMEQTRVYKELLYSKIGSHLVNRLKNAKLITRSQFESILLQIKDIDVKTIMSMKAIKLLFNAEQEFRKFKRVKFDIEPTCYNKISLKDLGISKEDVINLFRKERLINF